MHSLPNCDPRTLLQMLPIGGFVLDPELIVIEVNLALSELLGLDAEQLLGRPFGTLLAVDQRAELEAIRDTPATGGAWIQTGLRTASAGTLAVSLAVARLTSDEHAEVQLLGLTIVAGRQDTVVRGTGGVEQALSLAGVSTWVLDYPGRQITPSHNWHDIWGLPRTQEVDLELCLRLVYPPDRPRLQAALEDSAGSDHRFRVRFRIRRPDGRLRWLEATGHRDVRTDCRCQRVSGALMDVTELQDIEQTLARFRDIVSAMPDAVAFVDRGCRVLAANPAFLQGVGRPSEEVIGRSFKDAGVSGPLCVFLYSNLARCLDRALPTVADIRETTAHDAMRESEVRLFPHLDQQGKVTGIVVDVRDVTALREAERRLLQSAAVYSATSEGVLITDRGGAIIAVNSAFTQITGYTEAEALGQKPDLLGSQWHPRSFFIGMWRTLLRHGSWQGEVWNRRKNGEIYRQRLTTRRVSDSRGKVVNFVCVFAERSSLPVSPQRAEHLLHYDALTKLPNRLLFESRLEHALDLGRRKDTSPAVFMADIDHFSHINSSLGHQIGDELLRAVALRLREAIRPADTLARLHADQFGLLFEGVEDADEVIEIARCLLANLRRPFKVRGHEVFATVSIAVVADTIRDHDRHAVIARAEATLRRMKRQGRNGFLVASPPRGGGGEHKRLLGQVKSALETGGCQLVYRPRVDMDTDSIDGVEAAIRWSRRDLGATSSERLTAPVGDTRLMVELGQWSLETACRQLQAWLHKGMPIKGLAIEVSEALLTHGELLRQLDQLLIENPDARHRLELEFSESLLLRHCEQIAEVFDGLHRRGIGITLKEVGVGWSSPAVLQRLPVRALAIHPSCIDNLPDSKHDLAVVQAVIAMAQALELEVLADGVRTVQQRALLLTIGCQRAQGDLLGRPMSAAEFEQLPEVGPVRNPSSGSET